MRIAAILAAVIFSLAACGGGGSGSGPQSMIPPRMDPPSRPQGVSVSTSTETDGPTAAEVLDYLQVHASGGPWYSGNREFTWRHAPGLARYSEIPTVRIAEGTNDHQRAMILHAVAMVNHALPYESHIKIGDDAPMLAPIHDVPDSQIFVDFALHDDWLPLPDPNFRPTGQAAQRVTIEDGKKKEHVASHIWIDSRLDPGRRVTLSTMVHELLHALGFGGHVGPDKYPESFLREILPPFETQLGQLDIAALQVFYMTLGVATELDELSISSLGPWEQEAVALSGTLGTLSFGVRHRNRISVPWTDGSDPATTLADNRALRGTVTWNGELLGFTPGLRPVRGNAQIGVEIATMNGHADFTELQSWDAGSEPSALGTGVQWNTGSLGYSITVGGNYLRSTGGDVGTVNGRFYGSSHEGVSGTLERSDLTAAFGAAR